jgi:hypothetical protein
MKFSREAIGGDLDEIIFNAVTATTPKWRKFKLLR